MRRNLFWSAVFLLLLIPSVYAQTGQIQLGVKEHTLTNGMRILVLENHSAPVFTAIIRFNTGSLDEHPGITGSSHLLEHMLFKGTKIFGTSNYQAEVPLMTKIDSLAHLMYAEQVKLMSPLNPSDSARLKQLKQQIADLQSEEKKYVIKDELWSTLSPKWRNGTERLDLLMMARSILCHCLKTGLSFGLLWKPIGWAIWSSANSIPSVTWLWRNGAWAKIVRAVP